MTLNGVAVALVPAGHVLGSAQVRLEHGGQVWVASGDYKVAPDPTCAPFEPVRCDVFITESTFGLPIYRWRDDAAIFADINAWWQANVLAGRASVLSCYSFGKAQRILAGVDASIGPIVVHGAVEPLNRAYRQTSTYWEMVYGMAKHGVVATEFLLESNGEGLLLFARVEPYLAAIRAKTSPRALMNAEWIAGSCDLAKAIMTTFRGRIAAKHGAK